MTLLLSKSKNEGKKQSHEKNIYPSTYINPKKRRFYKVVCKKNKEIFLPLYLVNAKKR
jgi:hypothetical protein